MTRGTSQAESLASHIAQLARKYSGKVHSGAEANEEIKSISSLCTELSALINLPETWVDRVALSYNSSTAIRMLLDLKIFHLLSKTHEATSLDTLARLSGCSKPLLRCALRECVEQHILDEPSLEFYRLNSRSAYLLDENSACWVHYLTDVGFHAAASLPEYVNDIRGRIPDSRHTTAFQMEFKTNQSFYQWLRTTDPERGERFDKGLHRHIRGAAQTSIEDVFDFSQLQPGARVVDVGGGRGQHSIRIARKYSPLSFIIQDYETVSSREEQVSDLNVLDRLQWQQHDYFKEQPVKGADLYLLSNIMMDNTSGECREILERIVDAMTPHKSTLLIDDAIDLGAKQCNSSYGNSMNMHMLACLGTLFRTSEEWETLFSQVSGGLSVTNSWVVDGGRVIFELKRLS